MYVFNYVQNELIFLIFLKSATLTMQQCDTINWQWW